ncbi:MAG: SIS domain-containing protein [Clostridia bacterium]|nr:SIS domain-containing protein [Clostridia bacterium]
MNQIEKIINENPALAPCRAAMEQIVSAIVTMHRAGGKLLLCGNGGSASDCEHISGELLKGFLSKRPIGDELPMLDGDIRAKLQRGIGAVPLPSLSALSTAFSNDVDPMLTFAQSVYALGQKGDVVLGLSTSGNAKNVVAALKVAKAMGLTTVAMTGESGGEMKKIADITLCVPETETYKVQQLHLPAYHAICAEAERILFG